MTKSDLPLQQLKAAIIAPDVSKSDGFGRFICGDRFAITAGEWLVLIPYQSFTFCKSHPTKDWKAIPKTTESTLTATSGLSLFDIQCGETTVALAARHPASQPLVALLKRGGTPPESIQRDWRKQLAKFGANPPNICRVLCQPDGLLAVIPEWEPAVLKSSSKSPGKLGPGVDAKIIAERFASWTNVTWPWQQTNKKMEQPTPKASPSTPAKQDREQGSMHNPVIKPVLDTRKGTTRPQTIKPAAAETTSKSQSIKPQSKRDRVSSKREPVSQRRLLVTGAIAGSIVLASVIAWASWPSGKNNPQVSSKPVAEEPLEPEKGAESAAAESDEDSMETLEVSSDLELAELSSSDSFASLDSLTSGLDSFAALEGKLESVVKLDELDTSNIIARSLQPKPGEAAPSEADSTPMAQASELGLAMSDELEGETATAGEGDKTDENIVDDGIAPTEFRRKDRLTAASKRERVNFGFNVPPKEAGWSVQLDVDEPFPKSFVFAPDDVTSMVGPGKASWVLGLEDEEPELIVEMTVKPGRRWELLWQVGYRETRAAPARLIGPDDARRVLSQLVSAKSFVGRMLLQNQAARDARLRGPIDLTEQRRQLERQDREIEQAINRWKTIDEISGIVFRQTQISFDAVPGTNSTN
ncbi:hypothetical protein SH449x_003405 [Pirellulaceae bacterium SH449]